jgi:uncharacterized membrane protein
VVYVLALAIGIVSGLRSMLALAAVSWAVRLGGLHVEGIWLTFLGRAWVAWMLTAFAIAELIADQLPTTPSRTVPVSFVARIVSGAVAGAVIGADRGQLVGGTIAGVLGAVIGTLGGRAVRARLTAAFGRDRPAAVVEDAVAIAGAVAVAAL